MSAEAAATTTPQTLYEKLSHAHEVQPETPEAPGVLYIDLHLIHEVTSPQAFDVLRERGIGVRQPDRTLATMDHSTPTLRFPDGTPAFVNDAAEAQVQKLVANCAEYGIRLQRLGDSGQGIVHVIGPELGASQPGRTIVCGDSHTSTHGAFGALAFGIGTSEVGYVLATQCLLQRRSRTMRVSFEGSIAPAVTAKDMALAMIREIGVDGATGHVVEYAGEAVRGLSMEGRMTLCNMTIEAGGRAGLIAPDDVTIDYVAGRPMAPEGAAWDAAVTGWRSLHTDPGARFDREVTLNASTIRPMVTYGTHPGMAIAVDGCVPAVNNPTEERALEYMGLRPGQSLLGQPLDVVFVGSCTNGRLSDLRAAASLLRGQRIADCVRLLVVPGSADVKRRAEAEGLDQIFRDAGAEWRESGCSMCIAMNGDQLQPGQYCLSTSNRNFEGRQGRDGRTFLASPLTAAASALRGAIADPRELM